MVSYHATYLFYKMIKKIVFILVLFASLRHLQSQVLYEQHFSNLTLTTSSLQASKFSDVPGTMLTINNGNLAADTLSANFPFKEFNKSKSAWLVYNKTSIAADTFAVSTSWLLPAGTSDAWLITPVIVLLDSAVVSWEAASADANHLDGYDVYVITDTTTTITTTDFVAVNKIASITAENYKWTKRGALLSQYAHQKIRIAFRHTTTNQYQLWLDDIVVEKTTNLNDVETQSFDTYKYSTTNTANAITATFKNNGYTPQLNLVINYQVGAAAVVTETVTLATPLNYNQTQTISFTTLYSSATATLYPIKIWLTSTNTNTVNDVVMGTLTFANTSPTKKVLVEEYTSSNYGWAPDAQTKLQSIASNTNVVVVALHDSDNLKLPYAQNLITNYAHQFPSITIDQYNPNTINELAYKNTEWQTKINNRLLKPSPVTVSLTNTNYDTVTGLITTTLTTNFLAQVNGDYRINIYVKENNVYGPVVDSTFNGYNQLSFMQNVPTSPYYALGSYYTSQSTLLNATEYKHQFVLDTLLEGAYGAVIPTVNLNMNTAYIKPYAFMLPKKMANEFRYNANNIYLIAVVSEFDNVVTKCEILNVFETKLTTKNETLVGLTQNKKQNIEVSMYPNPANNYVTVKADNNNQPYTITITNILGNIVSTKNNVQFADTIDIQNLAAGNYFVTLTNKQFLVTKKLIIIK